MGKAKALRQLIGNMRTIYYRIKRKICKNSAWGACRWVWFATALAAGSVLADYVRALLQ